MLLNKHMPGTTASVLSQITPWLAAVVVLVSSGSIMTFPIVDKGQADMTAKVKNRKCPCPVIREGPSLEE